MRVPQLHSIKTKYSESQCGGQVANSGSTIKTGEWMWIIWSLVLWMDSGWEVDGRCMVTHGTFTHVHVSS